MSDTIFTEHFLIPSDTNDVQLHLIRKCLDKEAVYGESRTILMMHGATYSSDSLYDTPVEGASFMDHLAVASFDVYAVDVRGYGRSTRPAEMHLPAAANAPQGVTAVAIRDFGCAVNFVLRSQQLMQLNVIGMSWGGTVTAAYTTQNNPHVRRLGLIAPQWLSRRPVAIDRGGDQGEILPDKTAYCPVVLHSDLCSIPFLLQPVTTILRTLFSQ